MSTLLGLCVPLPYLSFWIWLSVHRLLFTSHRTLFHCAQSKPCLLCFVCLLCHPSANKPSLLHSLLFLLSSTPPFSFRSLSSFPVDFVPQVHSHSAYSCFCSRAPTSFQKVKKKNVVPRVVETNYKTRNRGDREVHSSFAFTHHRGWRVFFIFFGSIGSHWCFPLFAVCLEKLRCEINWKMYMKSRRTRTLTKMRGRAESKRLSVSAPRPTYNR